MNFRILALLASVALLLSVGSAPAVASKNQLPIQDCRVVGNNTEDTPFRFEDSGHVKNWSKFLSPTGSLRALVIATDFTDVPAKTSLAKELEFLSEVKSFYLNQSQNKLRIEFDAPLNWVRMPKTAAYYKTAFWSEKINDAIDTVDAKVDFSKYDFVIFYISKKNKITTEAGALPGFPDRKPDGLSQIRGVYLGNDGWRQLDQDAAVTIHELMHVFGLPDLYLTNKDGSKNVGVFDLMSEYQKKYGPRLFYWHRWKLNWIDDGQVSCLDPKVPQTIVIDKSNSRNALWVLPHNQRLIHVIQPWVVGSKITAIAYRVDPKDFVWNTSGTTGSGESPIQMLRPVRAGKAPKSYSNPNLIVVLANKDRIETKQGVYTVFVKKGSMRLEFKPLTK